MRHAAIIGACALAGGLLGLAVASCDAEDDSTATPASTNASGGGAGGAATASSGAAGAGGPVVVADCADGWCRIPAGVFTIGSPEDECGHPPSEENQLRVTLTRSFQIGQYEVTQAQWESHGLTNPSIETPNNPIDRGNCIAPDCPVGNVNWFEAAAYSNVLSQAEGLPACYQFAGCTGAIGEGMTCSGLTLSAPTVYDCAGYRLPTEAEWEYAARAGTTTPIYSGELAECDMSQCYADANLEAIAWFCANSGAQSHPVAELMPNDWGLYDVIGNLNEVTHSLFTPGGYGSGPSEDPGGEVGSVDLLVARSTRGCPYYGWNSLCRAAERSGFGPDLRAPSWGVRLARTLPD